MIRSPKDAYNLRIGMIHQHFKLVDVFTATENIALGLESLQIACAAFFTWRRSNFSLLSSPSAIFSVAVNTSTSLKC